MKNVLLFVGVLLTSVSMNAQQSIEGLWNTGQDQTKIEIKNSEGKIHSSENAKASVGKLIVKDLSYTNNTYVGKLYLIRKNRWVDASFVRKEHQLIISISAGFQKKTIVWHLVN